MAPEQAQGKHVDHRADIYSLGASAYAMLTGRPPFVGANEYDVIYKQLNEDPKPPSELNPGGRIPPWLDAALLKAMAKDPQERYQTMREFGAALEASAVMEQPTSTRSGSQVRPAAQRSNIPVSPAVIVAAVVALALIGALATYLFVLD
jgi:serine/threonine-protein kinase